MNAGKILVAILIIIIVAIAAIFLMSRFPQTQPIYNKIADYAGQAKDYVQKNLALVTGSVGGLTALGGVAASLSSKLNSAKASLTQVTDTAKTQITDLQTTKTALEQKLTTQAQTYEKQIADIKNTQTTIKDDTAKKLVETQNQLQSTQAQAQAIQNSSNQFIQGLMKAANGALVSGPDGKVYSVLKIDSGTQVK